MKKIKSLILFCTICLTCSFTRPKQLSSSNVGTFTIDYQYSLIDVLDIETNTYTFSYGQKFVLTYGDYLQRNELQPLTIVKTISNENYFTVRGKYDLEKLNTISSKYFKLPKNATHYVFYPIDDYKLSENTFDRMYNLTSTCFGLETNGEKEQEIDYFFADLYDERINIKATDNQDGEDLYKPVIDGYTGVYITNVNNPATVEEIQSHLHAYDDVDGDITDKIAVTNDKYTDYKNVIGYHDIVFGVEDNAGNSASITIKVKVEDTDKPIFNGPSEITSNLSNPIDIKDIESQVTVSDNYDKELKVDIEDNYTENKLTVGNYNVIFNTQDSSGNTATKTVVVHVKDDIAPVINGNSSYVSSIHQKIDIQSIINGFTITDNVDGEISNENITVVLDEYSDNYNSKGSYNITFNVKDSSGNISKPFIVTVNVEDHEIPQFYVDSFIINCEPGTEVTKEKIVGLLRECNTIDFSRISDEDKQIIVTYNDYNNSDKEGKYRMGLKVSYDDGEVRDLSVTINKEAIKNVAMPWHVKLHSFFVHYSIMFNDKISRFFDIIYSFFYNLFH